jgi:DNA-binding LytR/AlgR family response regulator
MQNSIDYLIIEDEALAAEKLENHVSELRSEWNLLGIIPSIRKAVRELPKLNPGLIFLDVHLSDGDSFQIFEEIDIKVPIIFTTAYDQYALKAFKLHSIDYLLKPVILSDLELAINKWESLKASGKPEIDLKEVLQKLRPSYKERFMVTTGVRIKSLDVSHIAFFYAQGKHAFITDMDGKEYLLDKSLTSVIDQLDPQAFFQINRQYIVAIKAISEMVIYSKGRLKLQLAPNTPTDCIVSVEKAPRFKKWLEGE